LGVEIWGLGILFSSLQHRVAIEKCLRRQLELLCIILTLKFGKRVGLKSGLKVQFISEFREFSLENQDIFHSILTLATVLNPSKCISLPLLLPYRLS
jgi:hypothetical protein